MIHIIGIPDDSEINLSITELPLICMGREEAKELHQYLLHEYINPIEYPLVHTIIREIRKFLEENKDGKISN